MPQVINTNVAALNAQRNLNKSQTALQTSMQRLSSGLRINSAKDDAAGLAISDRFISQINGMNQASRNANDGISLAQTAEGALDETTNALQRMRTLAVQAANDTNSLSDRQAIQLEIDQLVSEINRIGNSTQFNGKNVLDGSDIEFSFQIGANAGQTLSVSMSDMRASALGRQPGQVQTESHRLALSGDAAGGNIGVAGLQDAGASGIVVGSGDVTISVAAGAQNVDIAEMRYGGNIVQYSSGDLSDPSSINYGQGSAKQIAERVNAIRDLGEIDSSGQVVFEGVYATAKTVFSITDAASGDTSMPASGSTADYSFVGVGTLINGDLNINGIDIGPVSMQKNDADGSLVNAINAKSSVTGVTASINRNGALTLTAEDGRDILLKTRTSDVANLVFAGGGNAVNGSDDSGYDFTAGTPLELRITGQVFYSAKDTISVSGNAEAYAGLDDTVSGSTSGSVMNANRQAVGTIQNADVTTVEGANRLMSSVDSALEQVDSLRAVLGAVQNRFEMTIRNLDNVAENLSAANSRIRDADFAKETAEMTRSQILQQAGVSILSQANALSQNVMQLLQ
jgi:flagellin